MTTSPIDELTLALREFADERDWEKFHTPKNLAMSVLIEAAEIAEHFQWQDAVDHAYFSEEKRNEVAMEIADTLLYLLRLSDVLGIDPVAAARVKMGINAARYPVGKSYGRSTKHDAL